MRRALLLIAATAILPRFGAAQGALAVQGFGYPTGQIGSASLGTGGATAEIDPSSALNPATLNLITRYSIYVQYEPEYRRTSLAGGADKSTTFRFPAFMITGGTGKFTAGLSATTLLDRTWRNVYRDTQVVGGDPTESIQTAQSSGAITDTRAALGYWLNPKLQFGVAIHALVGENRLVFGRSFPDSSGAGDIVQQSTINYSGRAVSAGVLFVPSRAWVLGASVRRGGSLDARQDGADLSEAEAPDRYGMTVAFTGIPSTVIAARYDHTGWTSMAGLGTPQMSVFDADDIGVGMEVVGPRMSGASSFARLGFRSRTLPFGADGEQVSERAVSGGVSLPFARGRAQADLTLQRATRNAGDIDERAWFFSVGLGIRP